MTQHIPPSVHQVDAICTALDCTLDTHPGAPVPLCGNHLKVAFAYVLSGATGASDEARMEQYTAPKPSKPGYVYFIRRGNLVKIGWSAEPAVRFKALKPDAVLALMPGSMRDEQRCHAAFAHLREHGEWFRPEADLLAFIDDLPLVA